MWTPLKNVTQKVKRYLVTYRMDPKTVNFDRSSIYYSWTFDPKKCVFDRSRVARRKYVFAKLTDSLIPTDRGCLHSATPKSRDGRFYTVTKLVQNPSSPPDVLTDARF